MSGSSRPRARPPVAGRLRELPAVDLVVQALAGRVPGGAARAAARAALDELRAQLLAGRGPDAPPDAATLAQSIVERWRASAASAYPRAVNASGVFLHTGLGRAPLAERAARALAEIATGFTVLEIDPASGERRHREHALLEDLRALVGGASGLVVNNNAAALLLALAGLARGRQVIVSRGELIEIGGGFRLPELMALSGCRLVEVGTTNRTYARDYEDAIGPETALLLRVHTSNYRVVGFRHDPERAQLVAVARASGVPLLEDIGSGLPFATGGALATEPDARACLQEGVDLVCFSGDKLLGGPQAGVLAGSAPLVERCRRDPLFRALRPDRLTLAALSATLAAWREDPRDVPTAAALAASPESLAERARALAQALSARFPQAGFLPVESAAQAGSGSLPARELRSAAVEVRWPGRDGAALAAALRTGRPPVIPALWQGRVRLDAFALLPGDEARLLAAFDALGDGEAAS